MEAWPGLGADPLWDHHFPGLSPLLVFSFVERRGLG